MYAARMTKGRNFFALLSGLFFISFFSSSALASPEELATVQERIQSSGARWQAAETSISQLPAEQRRMRLGLVKGSSSIPAGAPAPAATAATKAPATPPATLDYNVPAPGNTYGYVTPIRDQGNCGSCWAFGTTATLESQYLMSTNGAGQPTLNLSEQILLSCSNAGTCYGGFHDQASNYILSTGLPPYSCYPYTELNWNGGPDTPCANAACPFWQSQTDSIKGWEYVSPQTATTAANATTLASALESYLDTYGPLVTTMYVYTDLFYYSGGIYSFTGPGIKNVNGQQFQNVIEGGHVIEIVGYNHAAQYFIVKNSWGTGWGTTDPNVGTQTPPTVTTRGFFLIAYSQLAQMTQAQTGDIYGGPEFGWYSIAYTGYSQGPCNNSISPSSASVAYSGGNAAVGVTSPGCSWIAASNVSWISIVSGATGTGNGTVTYSVAASTAITQRVGTLTIAGKTFTVTQAAAPPNGSLQVTITPSGAVSAGAMWSVNGGASWNASAATLTGLALGNHTVTFKPVTCWNTPASQNVAVTNGNTTAAGGVYVQQTGSLKVTITPSGAVSAGAMWSMNGGASWNASAATLTGLAGDVYLVTFKPVTGWYSPSSQYVLISNVTTTALSGVYVQQTGSLKVTITPSGAVSAGAMWSVNGGASWNASAATLTGLAVGNYTVTFKPVTGWTTPASQNVAVTNGYTSVDSCIYVQPTGSLKVTITPSGAVSAGANWSVNGGASWNASAATLTGLAVGNYTVTFKPVTGWITPASQNVAVTNGYTSVDSCIYVQPTGSLKVTITPSGAVSAGANWSVNGGASWNASAATLTGLAVGNYTVTFKPVTGWITPASQNVAVTNGYTSVDSCIYVQPTGSLKVTITPSGAVSAGAIWSVNGGASWNASAATLGGLAVGNYTVTFKPVTGWITPASQNVAVTNGNTTAPSGVYVQQTGSLKVTITPSGAVSAGAMWSVNGGASWNASGATVGGLVVGNYTVTFKPVTGWNTPASQNVPIPNANTTTWASGVYAQPTGSLKVTITPSGAVSAGAIWSVNGGASWNASAATLGGLAVGNYTVTFKPVTGWITPASQNVAVTNGNTTAPSGVYVQQTGSLKVTITPSGAVSAGAMWSENGGASWNSSAATLGGLAVGNYTVTFKPVTGWTTPASQSVAITNGNTTAAGGVYVQQTGSLKGTITPSGAVSAGAMWSENGGASWNASAATLGGLAVGNYTVTFKPVTGWTTPASQSVAITNGNTTAAGGVYVQQTGK